MFFSRFWRIVAFFTRLLLSLAWWELFLPRLGFRSLVRKTRSERMRQAARRFRGLAIKMGGVMIKVGQFLSSRVDVLPKDFTDELAGLQDEVPAEDYEDVRKVAESEFGTSLQEKYDFFDPIPLAAASLGQAHEAKLRLPEQATLEGATGEAAEREPAYQISSVVVKIQRPNIEKIINTDLSALQVVGNIVQLYRPISRRANVPALLAEFTRTLRQEIDYLAEGKNAEAFAANFANRPDVLVPHVIWSHTTRRVLTLEDVQGIKITDYDAITRAGIDRREVASRLLDTYLQQIFEDGFFHADPHPGNLFVEPLGDESERPRQWKLTFVDFGMVGRIPQQTREGIRELLIGVGTQDANRVVKSYQLLGVLLPGADVDLLRQAEQAMFDRFWGKNMAELTSISHAEMMSFALQFQELIYNMPFQVPQDIIFLVRAVGILSGMCTGLVPDFNVWEHLSPYAQKLIKQEAGSTAWLSELGTLVRKLLALPGRVDNLLGKVERGELVSRDLLLNDRIRKLELTVNRGVGGLIFAPLLLGGIWLYLSGETSLAIAMGSAAGLCLIWVIRPRR